MVLKNSSSTMWRAWMTSQIKTYFILNTFCWNTSGISALTEILLTLNLIDFTTRKMQQSDLGDLYLINSATGISRKMCHSWQHWKRPELGQFHSGMFSVITLVDKSNRQFIFSRSNFREILKEQNIFSTSICSYGCFLFQNWTSVIEVMTP